MSGLDSKQEKKLSKYDKLSTEELETLLNVDLAVDEGVLDVDEGIYITEVLLKRNETEKIVDIPDVEESLKDFKEKYVYNNNSNEHIFDSEYPKTSLIIDHKKRGQRPNRKKYLRLLCVAAIIVVLILSLSITSIAYRNIWSTIAQWANGTLKFSNYNQQDTINNPEDILDENTPHEDELHSILAALNIEESLVPNWIPTGFNQNSVDLSRSNFSTNIVAEYKNGDKNLTVSITGMLPGTTPKIEVNEDSVVEYFSHYNKHYIATNMEVIKASWTNGPFYVEIFGDITEKDLLSMIDSIYER